MLLIDREPVFAFLDQAGALADDTHDVQREKILLINHLIEFQYPLPLFFIQFPCVKRPAGQICDSRFPVAVAVGSSLHSISRLRIVLHF